MTTELRQIVLPLRSKTSYCLRSVLAPVFALCSNRYDADREQSKIVLHLLLFTIGESSILSKLRCEHVIAQSARSQRAKRANGANPATKALLIICQDF